jgi:hypothetical protein
MSTLQARLTVHATTELYDQVAFVEPSATAKLVLDHLFKDGDGAGEADASYSERFVLSAGGSEVIDLGGLSDDLGSPVVLAAVKFLVVQAAAANAASATLRPNTAEPWLEPFVGADDTVRIPPGGALVLANPAAAGWPVTENVADKLLLANPGAAAITVDLMVVGVAA